MKSEYKDIVVTVPPVYVEGAWDKAGRPHYWLTMEESNGYTAQVDHGWGHFRLLKDGVEIARAGSTNYPLVTDDCIAIDKESNGATSWLWFRKGKDANQG